LLWRVHYCNRSLHLANLILLLTLALMFSALYATRRAARLERGR